MSDTQHGPFGEVIYSYSRAQAVADGELVDVTETAREAGIVFPVALTRAVWEDCVAWTEDDNRRSRALQNEAGRLWDVVWLARFAIRSAPSNTNTVRYSLHRVPRDGQSTQPRYVELVAVCGPGDDHEPVITIMQPGEE